MNSIKFSELSYDFLKSNNGEIIKIIKKDLDFYFKINIKNDKNYLIVFSNGAMNPQRSTPPIFMRSKWVDDFEASCIFIDDRTIHNKNLNIGWGLGTPDRHYLLDYSDVIIKISELLNYPSNRVVYYGSSAGGFMSIALATYHKGSYAIANNPQTYIHNYLPVHVNKMYKVLFPDLSKNEIQKKYASRFSLLNIMAQNKNIPKTIYLQNRLCKSDMNMHLKPFFRNADKFKVNVENINVILYSNEFSGHNPIGREKSVNYINSLIATDFSIIL